MTDTSFAERMPEDKRGRPVPNRRNTTTGQFETITERNSPTAQGDLTDRSGTIAAGGTSQQLAPANPNRRRLIVQNLSDDDLWWNWGADATIGSGSFRLRPDVIYDDVGTHLSGQQVTIIGPTTGQAFTAKEG